MCNLARRWWTLENSQSKGARKRMYEKLYNPKFLEIAKRSSTESTMKRSLLDVVFPSSMAFDTSLLNVTVSGDGSTARP